MQHHNTTSQHNITLKSSHTPSQPSSSLSSIASFTWATFKLFSLFQMNPSLISRFLGICSQLELEAALEVLRLLYNLKWPLMSFIMGSVWVKSFFTGPSILQKIFRYDSISISIQGVPKKCGSSTTAAAGYCHIFFGTPSSYIAWLWVTNR